MWHVSVYTFKQMTIKTQQMEQACINSITNAGFFVNQFNFFFFFWSGDDIHHSCESVFLFRLPICLVPKQLSVHQVNFYLPVPLNHVSAFNTYSTTKTEYVICVFLVGGSEQMGICLYRSEARILLDPSYPSLLSGDLPPPPV